MADNPDWGDLPPELLLKIATSCPDIHNLMRGVCKPWKAGLEATSSTLTISGSGLPPDLGVRFTALAILDLDDCIPAVTPQDLRTLQELPFLVSMSLKLLAREMTEEMLGVLSALPVIVLTLEVAPADITDVSMAALRMLNVSWLYLHLAGDRDLFTDTHLRRLAGLQIEQLDLTDTSLTDASISTLRDLPPLDSLYLPDPDASNSSISDVGLAELRGLPLTLLKIHGQFTDGGLDYALRGMLLIDLDVSCCNDISSEGLEVLTGMPLRSLDLSYCGAVSNLDVLRGLPLTSLNLRGVRLFAEESFEVARDMPLIDVVLYSDATDFALEVLRGKALTRLDLGLRCNATAVGFGVLEGMPLIALSALGALVLRGYLLRGLPLKLLHVSGFSDTDLDELVGMTLVNIFLDECAAVTDKGLAVLQGMPLTDFFISNCNSITDEGLEVFRGMALEGFIVMHCQEITDSGLEVVFGMPLTLLHVEFCHKTTLDGVNRVAGSAAVFFV